LAVRIIGLFNAGWLAEDERVVVVAIRAGGVLVLEPDPPQPIAIESEQSTMVANMMNARRRRLEMPSIMSPARLATMPPRGHRLPVFCEVSSLCAFTNNGEDSWSVRVEVTEPPATETGVLNEQVRPAGGAAGQLKLSEDGFKAVLPFGATVTVTLPPALGAKVSAAGLMFVVNAPIDVTTNEVAVAGA
jgi:hypothetical protein